MNPEEPDTQRRKELMLRAVQEQMTSAHTPEVRVHYDRLCTLGHSDAQARELIATALAFYVWHTLRRDGYSYADYIAELARLPEIEWHEGET